MAGCAGVCRYVPHAAHLCIATLLCYYAMVLDILYPIALHTVRVVDGDARVHSLFFSLTAFVNLSRSTRRVRRVALATLLTYGIPSSTAGGMVVSSDAADAISPAGRNL